MAMSVVIKLVYLKLTDENVFLYSHAMPISSQQCFSYKEVYFVQLYGINFANLTVKNSLLLTHWSLNLPYSGLFSLGANFPEFHE